MQIECNHKPSGTDPIYRVAMDKPKLFKKRSREKKDDDSCPLPPFSYYNSNLLFTTFIDRA